MSGNDLQVVEGGGEGGLTEAEALMHLRALQATNLTLRGRLQVIPAFELAAAPSVKVRALAPGMGAPLNRH